MKNCIMQNLTDSMNLSTKSGEPHYIETQLKGKIDPKVPLAIDHLLSNEDSVLQAVDMFCWGVFRKYERRDEEWYRVFRKKIRYDKIYLPP